MQTIAQGDVVAPTRDSDSTDDEHRLNSEGNDVVDGINDKLVCFISYLFFLLLNQVFVNYV